MTHHFDYYSWKRHAVLLAFTKKASIRRFQSVCVLLKGRWRGFEKSWMSSLVIRYSSSEASLRSFWLEKNFRICCRDPGQDWHDSSKSIRYIARDIGVSEFLIRQLVHGDIQYFLYNLRKGSIFITGHQGQEKRLSCKAFEQIQVSPPADHGLVFLREKNLQGTDDELTEQPLHCTVPTRCTDSNKNRTLCEHVWGGH